MAKEQVTVGTMALCFKAPANVGDSRIYEETNALVLEFFTEIKRYAEELRNDNPRLAEMGAQLVVWGDVPKGEATKS